MTHRRREEEPPVPDVSRERRDEVPPGGRFDRSAEESTESSGPARSPADPVGRLHRSAGNQAVGAALSEVEVSSSDAPAEREAERVASQIASGSAPPAIGRAATDSTVQRQPSGEPERRREREREREEETAEFVRRQSSGEQRPQSAEYEEAARKTGRALLQTPFGKRLQNQAGEMGEAFWGTLSGKVTTLTLAGGAVTGLTVANEELPVQPPSFPADAVIPDVEVPGLRVGITYEGPIREPSKVMLSFSYSPGGGGSESGAKRDENLGKRLFQFRRSLKTEGQLDAERRLLWEAIGGIPPGLSAFKPPGGSMGSAVDAGPDGGEEGGDEGDEGGGGGGGGGGSRGSRSETSR